MEDNLLVHTDKSTLGNLREVNYVNLIPEIVLPRLVGIDFRE